MYPLLFSSVLFFKNWFQSLVLFVNSLEIILVINGKWLLQVYFCLKGAFCFHVSMQILKMLLNLMLLFSETIFDNLVLICPYINRFKNFYSLCSVFLVEIFLMFFTRLQLSSYEDLTDLSELQINFGNILDFLSKWDLCRMDFQDIYSMLVPLKYFWGHMYHGKLIYHYYPCLHWNHRKRWNFRICI